MLGLLGHVLEEVPAAPSVKPVDVARTQSADASEETRQDPDPAGRWLAQPLICCTKALGGSSVHGSRSPRLDHCCFQAIQAVYKRTVQSAQRVRRTEATACG